MLSKTVIYRIRCARIGDFVGIYCTIYEAAASMVIENDVNRLKHWPRVSSFETNTGELAANLSLIVNLEQTCSRCSRKFWTQLVRFSVRFLERDIQFNLIPIRRVVFIKLGIICKMLDQRWEPKWLRFEKWDLCNFFQFQKLLLRRNNCVLSSGYDEVCN